VVAGPSSLHFVAHHGVSQPGTEAATGSAYAQGRCCMSYLQVFLKIQPTYEAQSVGKAMRRGGLSFAGQNKKGGHQTAAP